MIGNALDQALSLYRAPERRTAMRSQPIPRGVDVVLRLAAANQPLLQQTADRTHLDPGYILEATRFYVQQVLLEPGIDPLRILGLSASATRDVARTHHHWLQRWLHPDHADDEWQSEYASRINWAWQQLRRGNKHVRRHPDTSPGPAAPGLPATGRWAAVPLRTTQPSSGYWLRRVTVVSICGLLAGLFYLAATREDPSPPPDTVTGLRVAGTRVAIPAPIITIELPAVAPQITMDTPRMPGLIHLHPVAFAEDSRGLDTRPAAAQTPTVPHRIPATDKDRATAQAIPVDESGTAEGDTRTPSPVRKPVGGLTPTHTLASTSQPITPRDPTGPEPGELVTTAGVVQASPLPPIRPSGETNTTQFRPAPGAPLAERAPDHLDPEVALARISLARQQIRDLIRYLHSNDSVGSQDARLHQLRSSLQQRIGEQAAARVALDPPDWRTTGHEIDVGAPYRVVTGNQVAETGYFHAHMIWRDNAWQFAALELTPVP